MIPVNISAAPNGSSNLVLRVCRGLNEEWQTLKTFRLQTGLAGATGATGATAAPSVPLV
jgi:hypothetical protein